LQLQTTQTLEQWFLTGGASRNF